MDTKKLINSKSLKYFLPLIVLDFLIFGASYFYNKTLDFSIIILINLALAFVLGFAQGKTIIKKVVFMVLIFVINTAISIALLFASMVLPGSRQHDYVMYEVCLPAIKRHYGVKESEQIPAGPEVDKNGFSKWWYQHTECENNVWAGKGPIFSENPVDFVPVSK